MKLYDVATVEKQRSKMELIGGSMSLDFFGLSKVSFKVCFSSTKLLPGTRIALIPRNPLFRAMSWHYGIP